MTYLRSWIFSMIVNGETPNAMFCLSSPFPLQYEGMPSCPLGSRSCSCRPFLISSSYVHGPLSHLRARFTVTLMCMVHCHTYMHGPLSHLYARSTVTHMHGPLSHVHGALSHLCARSCHDYVHGSLTCARCTVTLMCTVNCHTYVQGPLSHLCGLYTVTLMCTLHCHLCARSTVTLMCTLHCHLCARSTVTLMCTAHCNTYVHGPQSHLCARSTVTLMCTVHCHIYVHGPLPHLCARSTVTLMCTVHCHTYVHGSLSHFTKNICLERVTKSANIMRFRVSNDKMNIDGLDRKWSCRDITGGSVVECAWQKPGKQDIQPACQFIVPRYKLRSSRIQSKSGAGSKNM